MHKLGRRQKAMLDNMIRFGGGTYLPEWRLDYHQYRIMESLAKRGLVRRALRDGVWVWQVVETGPEVRHEERNG